MQRIILSHVISYQTVSLLWCADIVMIYRKFTAFIFAVLRSRVWDFVRNIVVGWSDDNNFLLVAVAYTNCFAISKHLVTIRLITSSCLRGSGRAFGSANQMKPLPVSGRIAFNYHN